MDIKNKSVLVIGGWGLVGSAVTRLLIKEKPKNIIVTSLLKSEAEDAVKKLRKEFPNFPKNYFIPWWGNILVREEFKDVDRTTVLSDSRKRKIMLKDTLDELDADILKNSALYKLIMKHKPDIIIDCINTATGIAYQDVYTTYKQIKTLLNQKPTSDELTVQLEKVLCSMYIPQLIRHIQIFYNAMHDAKTQIYIKIGTSGTGGMGLNIPYTHSEEKPSRVLLSKSAVAGAHTLLLFLMGRTPDSAITKEIKPTAAIAWKRIEFGSVKKRGKEIELFDIPMDEAVELNDKFKFKIDKKFKPTGEVLKSVFIDTGENGIFSRGEFEAITAQKQMEFVTPEEIAKDVIFEIKGGNTGHDIINALDNATLHPTYRAGYMQHFAVEKLAELEKTNEVYSVAFEMLGPPRLSKLLYEIHILKLICKTMKNIKTKSPKYLSDEAYKLIKENPKLRSEILSIGIPILLPNGKSLLRGHDIKIPVFTGQNEVKIDLKTIKSWASDGWVDLGEKNMSLWKKRIDNLMKEANAYSETDTSSLHVRTKQYWNNFEQIDIGRVVSWIFIHEEKGPRMKD
jgi:hypothetical protein